MNQKRTKAPDVEFIKELIKQIGEIQQADMDNVSLFGTSIGTLMIFRLLIEVRMPTPFKNAFALSMEICVDQYHDGSFYTTSNSNNNIYNKRIVPGTIGPDVFYFHGTDDTLVPYDGGRNKNLRLTFLGAQRTAFLLGVEPYSKCPFSNHQSQQRIQILGYHISVDAVIRDKIFKT